ncbi:MULTISPECIES: thiamine pyrophosphate-dependent enzyme [unclassified Paenibacillus]|uniref:thiamine pyrophosphate-dependent enzyme n=1 Tax=unclassified Paenibacillus TaxID=185978 RepID=UPI001AE4E7D0|nr:MULTISPECIES: thiamine pyrophosphate-dependent enzyme [unclassified Paenibacillus]MBP1155109.1 acetolactate synthase-1/2/3 large subunit [Paenibacillus sp. PvP091]MBP1169507.1 acetolactate synthase-1/2/3 large subunit [Paenibacillus sp. PvR098]MBP2440535.1 acetolactate synthase-1/2/3 large subunit [Paenibacillus sp. PvP052]
MTQMTAAKAIVEVLLREGVEKAFCVPGESYLSVLNALYETPQIELISGRHEGGVSFMAEGYAKASGKVGVCFATRGPGATNLSIGLHTAHQDSTPMVAFIGQVERSFRGREGFQEIDMAEYFSHLVKWTVELNDAHRVTEIVHRAFHLAKSGRPGPVLISLPQDVLDEVAEMEFQETEILSNPRPDHQAVVRAKEILQQAKRPVIIAGGGVTGTKSARELVELADKLQAPVATAFRRFDAFPNQHPYYIGQLGVGAAPYLVECVREADVVLALGTRFSQITTQNYTLLASNTKLIHVDISPDELNKVYRPALGIVADSRNFMLDLLAELGESSQSESREAYIQGQRKKYEQYSEVRATSGQDYVNLEAVMGDLMAHLPSNTIFTSDAGNFYGWMAKHYRFQEEGTFVGPTSGAMGYALPAAIGAKVAQPEKTVVAYAGDGGFMMTMQELETAVRNRIPVLAIVANNNMYGTIRMHQEKHFPERVIATELSNPNFTEIMVSMGGHGELVEKNEDFVPALQRALASLKPALIEVRIDPQQVSVAKTIEEMRAAQTVKQK